MRFSCFLPIKKNSSRAPGKNVRPMGGLGLGLTELKLKQLVEADCFEEIVVSSDDEKVLNFASTLSRSNVKPVQREPELCTNDTPLELLTTHAGKVCDEDHIVWTHVTSPFTCEKIYRKAVNLYSDALELGHDSLASAVAEYKFANFRGQALNYGGSDFWPKTQELEPVVLISSAIFIAPKSTYIADRNRLGFNPSIYIQQGFESLDVDNQEDWDLAEALIALGYPR